MLEPEFSNTFKRSGNIVQFSVPRKSKSTVFGNVSFVEGYHELLIVNDEQVRVARTIRRLSNGFNVSVKIFGEEDLYFALNNFPDYEMPGEIEFLSTRIIVTYKTSKFFRNSPLANRLNGADIISHPQYNLFVTKQGVYFADEVDALPQNTYMSPDEDYKLHVEIGDAITLTRTDLKTGDEMLITIPSWIDASQTPLFLGERWHEVHQAMPSSVAYVRRVPKKYRM